MIIYKSKNDDIFTSTAHFLVNPVNTKGVMSKGLALDMKKRFPESFKDYHFFCTSSSPKGGDLLFYYPENINTKERPIINFFIKEDLKKPSELKWVEKGVISLINKLMELYPDGQYPSPLIALPIIGCEEAGLRQEDVLALIIDALVDIKFDVEIYI